MRSKEMSMEVKEAIVRLKNQRMTIREISVALGVANTTVWNILKKVESTGTLSNSHRPGRPRKTSKVEDRRIQSMVKKNPSTTSSQIKRTLQEAGVSLSKSTVKRRLHECKHKDTAATTRAEADKKVIKHTGGPERFWNNIVLTEGDKIKMVQDATKEK